MVLATHVACVRLHPRAQTVLTVRRRAETRLAFALHMRAGRLPLGTAPRRRLASVTPSGGGCGRPGAL